MDLPRRSRHFMRLAPSNSGVFSRIWRFVAHPSRHAGHMDRDASYTEEVARSYSQYPSAE